jgi:ATPase subunit of ABC transporter with duplicated ATPase domains
MISFSNINKQYGKQLLFVDASFQLNPGEKVGLVGPNGSGKTTLFRMVVGEELCARLSVRPVSTTSMLGRRRNAWRN